MRLRTVPKLQLTEFHLGFVTLAEVAFIAERLQIAQHSQAIGRIRKDMVYLKRHPMSRCPATKAAASSIPLEHLIPQRIWNSTHTT